MNRCPNPMGVGNSLVQSLFCRLLHETAGKNEWPSK